MNRIILADDQAIFRAGAARVLAREDDVTIVAQCEDNVKLRSAVDNFRGAVVVVSSSLCCDVPELLVRTKAQGNRVILVVENGEQIDENLVGRLEGAVPRNIAGGELIECVRQVARGNRSVQRSKVTPMQANESVGAKVRDRLTPKEMQIVALIVQGCKNKEIATQLGTKEQVIKNYLRAIYDKTGVSDRLELALFTLHHKVLAEAAQRAGSLLMMKAARSA